MDKKLILFIFFGLFVISFASASSYDISFGHYNQNGYKITQTGNENNYTVDITQQTIDIDPWWEDLLEYIGIGNDEKESRYLVEICSGDLSDKELKLKAEDDGWGVYNKTNDTYMYFVYNSLPKKDKDGNITKEIVKQSKQVMKDLKQEDYYCYTDVLNSETDDWVKYGNNSITFELDYIFGTQTIDNDTRTEADNIHLEINDSAEPWDGLVGYWSFDSDDNITAYDLSNLNNDGTYYGDAYVSNASGIYDDALVLDGDGDSVKLSNEIKSVNQSISIWVNIGSITSPSVQGIVTNELTGATSNALFIEALGFSYRMSNGSNFVTTRSSSSLLVDEWMHVVGTREYNGTYTNQRLYVNNTLVDADSMIGQQDLTTGLKAIGYLTLSRFYNGSIDEVMIFDKALTQQEITDIYNNQSKRFKDFGVVTLKQTNITTGYDRIVLNVSSEENENSKIQARLGYWDVSDGYNISMDGLVGYWTMDNSSWLDISENGNHGSGYGGATTGDGVYNNSGVFDGDGDYLDWNYGIPVSQEQYTLSTWVQTNSFNTWRGILISYPCQYLEFSNTNKVRFGSYNSVLTFNSVTSNLEIIDSKWHFVSAVLDKRSGLMNLYIDGELDSSGSYSGDDFRCSADLYSSYHFSGEPRYFNGSIDEVMIFNRTLSAEEIKELYIKGRANWQYSNYSEVDNGQASVDLLTTTATNILPEIRLSANNSDGNESFYSPFLYSPMTLNLTSTSINITNIQNPTNADYSNNPFCFNISAIPADYPNQNVGLIFNDTYYEMDNLGSNNYGKCLDLSANSYDYYYFANNTYNEFITGNYTLVISQATPNLQITSSEGWSLLGASYSSIEGINCPSQLTCNLYMEGASSSNPLDYLFAVGYYSFIYNTTGNQNYTAYSTNQILNSQTNQTGVQPQNLTGDNTLTIDYSDFMAGGEAPETICFKLREDNLICLNKDGIAK